MMKGTRDKTKKILNIIMILVIAVCLSQGILNITYANANLNKPDVTITVDENGRAVCEGDLLGKDLWYPGMEVSGVIRVVNHFRPVVLKDLYVHVTVNSSSSGMDPAFVYNSFLENMKLTVKIGKYLIFNETLFEDRSFLQLTDAMNGSGTGSADQPAMKSLEIASGDFVDLNYILHMEENASDELENLNTSVEVLLNLGDMTN